MNCIQGVIFATGDRKHEDAPIRLLLVLGESDRLRPCRRSDPKKSRSAFPAGPIRRCSSTASCGTPGTRLQLVVRHGPRIAGAVGARLRAGRATASSRHSIRRRRPRASKGLNVPIVNISGTLPKTPVPRVSFDNGRVGQLAADHLIERGFREFAYYGLRTWRTPRVRQTTSMRACHEAAFAVCRC